MLPDPEQAVQSPSPQPPPGEADFVKIRLRFRKDGDLRLVSHHDLMHCFERMFRRAALPFRSTQGFHPQPRMVFAQALALGVIGCEEILDVELKEAIDPAEIERRLSAQCPPGMQILSVQGIPPRAKAQVVAVRYRVAVPPQRQPEISAQLVTVLQATECWVERSRPQPRSLDIRPYLRDIQVQDPYLEMHLWVTPTGTARPEEVLRLLGCEDILTDGAILERLQLELLTENEPTPIPSARPQGQAHTGPATRKGAAKPEALLPGPLSFDS
jgi:radical SAM-linked protein